MDIRQLQYLCIIAEEGNFTRAAERLFVSQPALSQQIQKLEQDLNCQLLDRSGRQIRLTDAGELVYRHAQSIFQEVDSLRSKLEELQDMERGYLRIGVIQTVNAYLMPSILQRFRLAYPKIQLRVEELTMDAIEAGLETGDLHLGLGFIPTNRPSTEAEAIFTERLVLIVGQGHPLASESAIYTPALETDLVLLTQDYCTRRLWDDYAKIAELDLNIPIEMSSISAILELIAQTNSASVLPEMALAMLPHLSLKAIPLYEPSPERKISLLWRQGAYRSKAAQAFSTLLYERLQELGLGFLAAS